jgi:hypothetical protein
MIGEIPMGDERKVIKGKLEMAGLIGPIWCIGWLFTIGYAHLPFWRGVLAILLWPYYLGSSLG